MVDLSNCDKEPIHLVGKIQRYGFLLVVDKKTGIIEQASENVEEYLGLSFSALLGRPLASLLNPKEYAILEQHLNAEDKPCPQLFTLAGHPFFCLMHTSGGQLLLEGEPYQPLADKDILEATERLLMLQHTINRLESVEQITDKIAAAVHHILGYDRVLVFQFDQDWNAAVIAERINPGIHSFEGHHFPATDIPLPARELFRVKHVRHIPDVLAMPVPLSPAPDSGEATPVDLTKSELRYPSTIHLEYLRNMEVMASLSLSILVKGKLWGMISAHHQQPKFINYWQRQWCNQLAKVCSNMLLANLETQNIQQLEQYKQAQQKLVKQVAASGDLFKGLFDQEFNILNITESSGVALLLDNKVVSLGITPDKAALLDLAEWLSNSNSDSVFYTRELSQHVKAAEAYQPQGSGLLALEISRYNKEYLLFFKPEIKSKRIWAGDPHKPLAENEGKISPRKSFRKWEEVIKGKSQPWARNEVEVSQHLVKDLVAIRLRNQARQLKVLSDGLKTSAEELSIKNKKLEDFAHIITHNLRSPLNNIQALYALYKSDLTPIDIDLVLDKIKTSSNNMLETINDLNLILKTNVSQQLPQETIYLQELLDKEIQNLSAVIIQTAATIKQELGVESIYTHKVYLESILHNLISNALKYISPVRKPLIKVRFWKERENIFFSVSDNGLGMDLEKWGHKLFGLYQTFHQNSNARGIGLYLVKMQVESLGGTISVESKPGLGTTFTVAIPEQAA